ncbi:MAG TPA: DUF6622 family protein [Albitalea sp.]|nr:DUF6622 family protein [Albitalea sp.]
MPSNIPLGFLVLEIIRRTPLWVWAILAALVVLGLTQMRDRLVSRSRLLVTPIGLGLYSLSGAASMFGARPEVIAAWLAGLALAVAANRLLQWPRGARPDGRGNFAVPGSVWPLMLMMAIFGLRYVGSVTLAFQPGWSHDAVFSLGLALSYGTLSGMFTARALRVLGSERAEPALGVA